VLLQKKKVFQRLFQLILLKNKLFVVFNPFLQITPVSLVTKKREIKKYGY